MPIDVLNVMADHNPNYNLMANHRSNLVANSLPFLIILNLTIEIN